MYTIHAVMFAVSMLDALYASLRDCKFLVHWARSRFLELHVGDIPDGELATILEKRCALAPSYAAKLVFVMRELQRRRQV